MHKIRLAYLCLFASRASRVTLHTQAHTFTWSRHIYYFFSVETHHYCYLLEMHVVLGTLNWLIIAVTSQRKPMVWGGWW